MSRIPDEARRQLRIKVLALWATRSSGEIAAELGITRNVVLSIVRTARAKGNPRAITKPEGSFARKPNATTWRPGSTIWKAGVEARRA